MLGYSDFGVSGNRTMIRPVVIDVLVTWWLIWGVEILDSASSRNLFLTPDISVSLEYFISVGEQSYFVISPVGGQLHQFPCLASNTSHNRSVFFSTQSWNYSRHFCLFIIFCIFKGTSPFSHAMRVSLPPKANLVHFEQYCIILLISFLLTLLEQIKRYLSQLGAVNFAGWKIDMKLTCNYLRSLESKI